MSADTNGQVPDWTPEGGYASPEWAGLPPIADFGEWYDKARAKAGPLPAPEETAPFTPDWTDERLSTARHAGPVKCGCGLAGCPDGPRIPAPGDPRVLLSCAPGVTDRMWHVRVLDGTWEDIPRCARDGGVRVHKPAVDGLGRIHLDLEHGVLDIGAVFDQHPSLRSDPELHAGLAQIEAGFPARLAELQRFIAERATALRAEGRAA